MKPGQNSPPPKKRPADVLRRPAVALSVLVAAVALVAVAALSRNGDGGKRAGSALPSGTGPVPTAGPGSSAPAGPTQPDGAPVTATTKPSGGPSPTRPADGEGSSPAPWRASPVKRTVAPAPFLEAWQRAKNRSKCALLIPSDAGPRMEGATASFDPTPEDRGWDILLRREAGIIEVLGLFSRADQPEDRAPASFTRRFADGSEVRYGAEAGGGPEVSPDPEANAFEGVLTIPTQDCAYRIYDTLGLSHFEFVLDHLRFVEGAP